jgi:hypothetical protein
VKAAAEAVSTRLQTLYPDPAPEADPEPSPPVQPEPPAEPASQPDEASEEPAPVAETEPAPPLVEAEPVPQASPRIIIDDTAPFEFVPPTVQPLDTKTGDGVLSIVSLIVLGLAFFAGGVFWAFNAQPEVRPTLFTPLLVGWLAGVAGVALVAAAVFLLLQRITRAADRRDNKWR